MPISKAWDWNESKNDLWLKPSEESYFIAARWKERGYKELLDFGCGLGRHSVFFAKQGFDVSAFDLSAAGTDHLREWAERENLSIDIQVADMLSLPYPDSTFDCLFAYHVISHTDTAGMRKIMSEVKRVLKPDGELYLTLCSKESWSYVKAGYPHIDENTIIKTDDGPEKGIPHIYFDLDDVLKLFAEINLEPLRIRHTDDFYFVDEHKRNSKHYFILVNHSG